MTTDYDIIIVGSGMVGASLALFLAQKTDFSLALFESQSTFPHFQKEIIDKRVSAISAKSKNFFQTLAIWDKLLQKRVSPYQHMFIWDEEGSEITFDCPEDKEALGWIIEENVIRESLLTSLKKDEKIDLHFSTKLSNVLFKEDNVD